MRTSTAFLVALCAVWIGVAAAACGKRNEPAEKTVEKAGEPGGHQEGLVRLSAEQIRTAAIATAKAELRAEVGLLEATAQIEAAGDRQARVGSRIAGRIVALRAGVGDRVARGATLAIIDSPELGRAKADYISAMAAERVAREGAERERKLFERQISSEKDWREAEGDPRLA